MLPLPLQQPILMVAERVDDDSPWVGPTDPLEEVLGLVDVILQMQEAGRIFVELADLIEVAEVSGQEDEVRLEPFTEVEHDLDTTGILERDMEVPEEDGFFVFGLHDITCL